MMRRILIIIGVIWFEAARVLAAAPPSVVYEPADSVIIVRLLAEGRAAADSLETPGQLALFYAHRFLDRPYVAHTLEGFPDGERLIVNTRQLDCTTLVETVTALTWCTQRRLSTFADYCEVLRQLRYRQGHLDGYPSRLHYFSDWIADKTDMGFVSEVQQQHAPFTATQRLRIDYMSTHPQSYAALKRHPRMTGVIARQEQALSGRSFRYIPKSQVLDTPAMRRAVHNGDIIAITTSKRGLDIAHLGFALWRSDGLHLLNASMIHKKVVAEPMTLGQYLSKHPSHTGIRVIRMKK